MERQITPPTLRADAHSRNVQHAFVLFKIGALIVFLGSMYPWFMWSMPVPYHVFSALFFTASLVLSKKLCNPLFTCRDTFVPLLAFMTFFVYESIVQGKNVNSYLMLVFRAIIFYAVFAVDTRWLLRVSAFIAKVMGWILVPSIIAFILWLFGIKMAPTSVEFLDYSFDNYYLFLIDHRVLNQIFPRFVSYFPEPSHVGGAAAFLLFAQRGRWMRWYNIVLFVTLVLSFSLAAYVYMTVIVLLDLWIKKRKFLKKLAFTIGLYCTAVMATLNYNNGDNIVHNLILLRLEIDNGKLAGDDRVSDVFQDEYERFLNSEDVMFGSGKILSEDMGLNSGYRVFIYYHGYIGVFLIAVFYYLAFIKSRNKRAVFSALLLAGLYFIVSGFMLSEKLFLPLYVGAYRDD